MTTEWMRRAARRYDHCNRATLNWLLERNALGGGFLNTKVNALTGEDYGDGSSVRGPDFTYGWIQGRGLEALVTFATYYRDIDPPLAERLTVAARRLYQRLSEMRSNDGHAYFLYDETMRPVISTGDEIEPQCPAGSIFTYSDAFVAKGLFAASSLFDPARSGDCLAYLQDVIGAIEDGRFQMDEARLLSRENAASEPDDFGPRMILLAAAGLLHRARRTEETSFADRFIDHVLARHYDDRSGLLLTIAGEDICNVGHAIEFCGFAFEHLATRPEDARVPQLVAILLRSLDVGLRGPGIALYLSAKTGTLASPYFPWWPMPEAIRACALGYAVSNDARLIDPWKQADSAFFSNYWLEDRHFAYQTRTLEGPVDYVPATPDLDPAYHTGLSLLAAIRAITA